MAVAWSTDGKWILTGSKDGTARLWEASTGVAIRTVPAHTNWLLSVAFSPDSRRFATAGRDGAVRLWETETGRPVNVLPGHGDWVQQMVFSPDGRHIATGSADRKARLWEVETGRLLLTMEGHRSGISSLAFSPDGVRLATAGGGADPIAGIWGYDRSTILWDLHTGHRLLKLDAHFSWVSAVAFSPDGRRLATGSLDNTVRIRESFPWRSRDYPGGPQATLAGQTEIFKRSYWRDRMRAVSWAVPLGTRPLQPGRRLDHFYGAEVNLPAQPGVQYKPAGPLPPREPEVEANLVDLSGSYNVALHETWQPVWSLRDVDRNLSSLPAGVHRLAGVPFDMRGIIRLHQANVYGYVIFPTQVEIAVSRKFRRLHVLHGTDSAAKDGMQIGSYWLHYREGGSAELKIVYGRDVLDWEASGEGAPPGMEAEVAWTGVADQTQPDAPKVRVYKRTYENPAPEREVTRITFESAVTSSGPFLVAMTVEP